jgi:SAM-dependent methyltransferase
MRGGADARTGGSWPRSPASRRALDVGCGEGADAIWLARSGWTVTAIDISEVAVTRAREAAEQAGAAVEWVRGDALQTPFPAGSFDLVLMQYLALPKAAVRALPGTVRPSGLLFAVYHDLTDEHREHLKSQCTDPADYVNVNADDLARLLGDAFTIELHAVQPRIDPPPDKTAHRRHRPARPASLTRGPDWSSRTAGPSDRRAAEDQRQREKNRPVTAGRRPRTTAAFKGVG